MVLVPFSKAPKYIRSCWIHGWHVQKAACKATDRTAHYWVSLTTSSSSICPSPVDHRLFLHVRELIKLCWKSSFSVLKAPKKEYRANSTPGRPSEKDSNSLYCYFTFKWGGSFTKCSGNPNWETRCADQSQLWVKPGREPRSKLASFGTNGDYFYLLIFKNLGFWKLLRIWSSSRTCQHYLYPFCGRGETS